MSVTSTQKSYDIIPVNNKCSQVINHSAIVEPPNTISAKTSGSINSLDNIIFSIIINAKMKSNYNLKIMDKYLN